MGPLKPQTSRSRKLDVWASVWGLAVSRQGYAVGGSGLDFGSCEGAPNQHLACLHHETDPNSKCFKCRIDSRTLSKYSMEDFCPSKLAAGYELQTLPTRAQKRAQSPATLRYEGGGMMVDGSTVFTAVGEVTVCSSPPSYTILKWSPASRDEQYPLLCSLTSPRHWKCLAHPDMPSPSWKFQAHLLKAQSLHVALQRPWNEQVI